MTAAHTAVLAALHDALDILPGLAIRKGTLPPKQYGRIHYPTNTITIATEADVPTFASALMHELVHLKRGPGYADEIAVEEALVLAETARRLVPPDSFPWTMATDPDQVAAHLGIDRSVARLALRTGRRIGAA